VRKALTTIAATFVGHFVSGLATGLGLGIALAGLVAFASTELFESLTVKAGECVDDDHCLEESLDDLAQYFVTQRAARDVSSSRQSTAAAQQRSPAQHRLASKQRRQGLQAVRRRSFPDQTDFPPDLVAANRSYDSMHRGPSCHWFDSAAVYTGHKAQSRTHLLQPLQPSQRASIATQASTFASRHLAGQSRSLAGLLRP
jgi:hypothetical protein